MWFGIVTWCGILMLLWCGCLLCCVSIVMWCATVMWCYYDIGRLLRCYCVVVWYCYMVKFKFSTLSLILIFCTVWSVDPFTFHYMFVYVTNKALELEMLGCDIVTGVLLEVMCLLLWCVIVTECVVWVCDPTEQRSWTCCLCIPLSSRRRRGFIGSGSTGAAWQRWICAQVSIVCVCVCVVRRCRDQMCGTSQCPTPSIVWFVCLSVVMCGYVFTVFLSRCTFFRSDLKFSNLHIIVTCAHHNSNFSFFCTFYKCFCTVRQKGMYNCLLFSLTFQNI